MKSSILPLIFISLFLTACSTTPTQTEAISQEDPYENYNRKMYNFNMAFDEYVGQPVGKAYKTVTPQPVRTGIGNFFNNLKMPVNMLNNFLQGKGENGLKDFMRFSMNTVFGFAGFIDIATPAGLAYEKNDFGKTLYKWGAWENSNFIVLPILGASTPRELTGGITDYVWDPTYRYLLDVNQQERNILFVTNLFNTYSEYMDLVETLKNAPDPYIFYRESYIQHRNNLLYEGKPPLPSYDEFDFD